MSWFKRIKHPKSWFVVVPTPPKVGSYMIARGVPQDVSPPPGWSWTEVGWVRLVDGTEGTGYQFIQNPPEAPLPYTEDLPPLWLGPEAADDLADRVESLERTVKRKDERLDRVVTANAELIAKNTSLMREKEEIYAAHAQLIENQRAYHKAEIADLRKRELPPGYLAVSRILFERLRTQIEGHRRAEARGELSSCACVDKAEELIAEADKLVEAAQHVAQMDFNEVAVSEPKECTDSNCGSGTCQEDQAKRRASEQAAKMWPRRVMGVWDLQIGQTLLYVADGVWTTVVVDTLDDTGWDYKARPVYALPDPLG